MTRLLAPQASAQGLLSDRLVEFEWQPVGVGEEHETSAGVLVEPDVLTLDADRLKARLPFLNVFDGERQVTQAACFGTRWAGWRVGKGKQFQLCAVGQRKVELERAPRGPAVLGDHTTPQHLYIEPLRPRIVGADHRHMMDTEQRHGCTLQQEVETKRTLNSSAAPAAPAAPRTSTGRIEPRSGPISVYSMAG